MMRLFLFLFITVPLLELYVLIEVGSGIGGLNTIALCLITAAIGGLLVREQGLKTLWDARRGLATGHLPTAHMAHGLMIALAGVLLFTPGFITDAAGFVLLIPPFRRMLIQRFVPQESGGHTWIEAEIIDPDERYLP